MKGGLGIRSLMLAWALLAAVALAADVAVVEDWSDAPIGHKGIPPGWQKQDWGRPSYDFTVVEQDGHRVVHLKSAADSSTVSKDIKGVVRLAETPVLEWTWKVIALPKGADARSAATDDEAAQLYVVWPRFPHAVRSRIIGYIRDVRADFKQIYGEDPEDPGAVAFGIDSDDVKGTAESYMGRIGFRRP
jgi:hypothetical protein